MVHCFKSWNKREKNEIDFNFSELSNDSPKVNHGTVFDIFLNHPSRPVVNDVG